MYAIIDIETTGYTNKITEISILVYNGKSVVNEFTTLVNPECSIPPFITNLTGITNAMVSNAPKFYEIAKKVNEITTDTIFVAHSVNFDYNIIRKEFKDLGFDFSRKKLCTVRLSRAIIPGLNSYSLGALCASQGITIKDRHRAKGDAEATVKLFGKLLKQDKKNIITASLHPKSRHATLPPLMPKKQIDELPETTGVYYFKNEKNEIIYVGKALNIKQRVISHFYDKSKKEITMCLETTSVNCIETGSELIALLHESAEIKHWYPKFNRSQKRFSESIGLFYYEDQQGILHIAWNRLKLVKNPISKFYNETECRLFIEQLCEKFELCPKYCHLQSNVSTCFHYQIKQCKGVCKNEESIENYNKRVAEAIESVQFKQTNFVIRVAGRHSKEYGVVLIANSIYRGYGYVSKRKKPKTTEDFMEHITLQKDNQDSKRIIHSFIKKITESPTESQTEIIEILAS